MTKLTQENIDKSYRLFYGEGKSLGEVAEAIGCYTYDLSPWLYRASIRQSRAEAREDWAEVEKACAEVEKACTYIDEACAYVEEAIASFDRDPADTEFQAGYLAALFVVAKEALGMEIEDPTGLIDDIRSTGDVREGLRLVEGGKADPEPEGDSEDHVRGILLKVIRDY